ncbi:MAG: four helix bundle protein, partial [Planctomycetota bacterium]|nr:four helix bundle protein [Planctomycetota bacterium]
MDREPARRFEDLIVWQKAHALVLTIYRTTESFPRTETYGLTSQLRRSAVSIPANIAEGFRKRGRSDKARFLNISQGSLEETRYYLILARDLVLQLYFPLGATAGPVVTSLGEGLMAPPPERAGK